MVVIASREVLDRTGQLNVYTLVYSDPRKAEDAIVASVSRDQPVIGVYDGSWIRYTKVRKELEKKGINPYMYIPVDPRIEFAAIKGIDPRILIYGKHSALLSFMAQNANYKIRPTKSIDRRTMLTSPFKSLLDYYPAPILIQPETCKSWKHCTNCLNTCPFEALKGKPPQVNLDKCTGCGLCTGSCPFGLLLMPQWNIEAITYFLSIIRRNTTEPGYIVGICNESLETVSEKDLSFKYLTVFINIECPGWLSDYHILVAASKGFSTIVYCDESQTESCGGRELFEERLRNLEPLGVNPKIISIIEELEEALSKPPSISPLDEDYSIIKEKTDAYKILNALGVEKVKFNDAVVGLVKVDDEKCLVCDACSNLCPFRALERLNEGDKTELIFHMDRCTACGICEKVCPHDALVLDYEFDNKVFKEEKHVLAEDEIARCRRCGKPIGSKKHLLALEKKLRETGADDWVIEQLWLCQECKLKTVIEKQLFGKPINKSE